MNERAFIEFHRRVEKPFWGYLVRLTGNPQTADDLCQESYLRLLSQSELPTDFQALKAYLFRIGSRLVIDGSRRRRFEGLWSEVKEPTVSSVPGENVDVARAMQRLKPRQRALVWLAYVEQYSHEEIADILGLAKLSVRVLLSRARKRLTRELESSGGVLQESFHES